MGHHKHLPEDTLEAFSLGKLGASQLAQAEEHLLICPRCLDRVAEIDAFVRALKEATRARAGRRRRLVARRGISGSAAASVAVRAAEDAETAGYPPLPGRRQEDPVPSCAVPEVAPRGR